MTLGGADFAARRLRCDQVGIAGVSDPNLYATNDELFLGSPRFSTGHG
jgi:hypothetical protein